MAQDWHAAGCACDCSEQHTYTWGRCALAPESARPQPTISIGRVEPGDDGRNDIVLRSVPVHAWVGQPRQDALITVAKSMALDADPDIAPAYPDAAARRALGALHDAGLLDDQQPAPAPTAVTGYCPACGRGDVAPTADAWEQQRQRAERAEAANERVRAALPPYTAPILGERSRGMQMGWDRARQTVLDALDGGQSAPAPTATQSTDDDCCGSEPPTGGPWGDCWCTLPPSHEGEHRCQPCTDRHGAPGWKDDA